MRKRFTRIASVVAHKGPPLLFELSGLVLISTGFFLVAPFLGFVVAGATLLGVGWVMDGKP